MSKVVTIPKDRNPFVVIVNGVKYSYPAGVTTEVPDEVADVIEKYVGAKPKPDPNAGINFGGAQSDWNQTDSSAADFIKNKPFGDELVEIMPETELTGTENEGMYEAYIDHTIFSDNESQLTVKFDGVEYTCSAIDSSGFTLFGNMKYMGGDDTGEPFVLMAAPQFGVAIFAMPDVEPHTVSIIASRTMTLDKKYINASTPFYVSDADDYLYTDTNLTTKATKTQLNIARKLGFVYVSFPVDDADVGIVCYPHEINTNFTLIFGYVTVLKNKEYKYFYTAEYVPES